MEGDREGGAVGLSDIVGLAEGESVGDIVGRLGIVGFTEGVKVGDTYTDGDDVGFRVVRVGVNSSSSQGK